MELQNAGYTYDYFSPYLLLNEGVSCADGLINADGVAYQALILMEEEMPIDAAERILEWAKEGLPVLFVNHAEEIVANDDVLKINEGAAIRTGSNNSEDEALAAVTAELKTLPNVKEVESEEDAYEALQEMGVRPRAEYTEANTKILPVLRSTHEADYMYLYHYMYEDEEDFSGQVSLDGVFTPYVIDTWSGEVAEAENYHSEDGRTLIDYTLAPGETLLLALRKEAADASVENTTETRITEQPLEGWTLTVDSYEPGEKILRTEKNEETGVETTEAAYTTEHVSLDAGELKELIPWKDISEVGETVSGVGTYSTTFTFDKEMLENSRRILFRVDSFCGGTAALWINGTQVPVNMDRRSADLTGYVQEGENTLEVRVSSSLRNKMLEVGYEQGWNILTPEVADYGMTGEARLVVVE